MFSCFKLGDKFYAQDFSEDMFLKLQQNLIEACMGKECRLTLEEGRDTKGYYITLAEKSAAEKNNKPLYSLQHEMKEELEYAFEVAMNKPVLVEEAYYDCDNLSVLRIMMLLKAKDAGLTLPEAWLDRDNKSHTKDINLLLIKILQQYRLRNEKLDEVFNKILDEIYSAESKEELQKIDFSSLGALYGY